MNEQNPVPVVAVESNTSRRSRLPLLLVILLLLFLIPIVFLFSRWLLDSCIQAIQTDSQAVLGVTNLAVDADVNQAAGGDNVVFTVTGDNTGPLANGIATFSTNGKGTISAAPVGSGICITTSNTTATCSGINLANNEALRFTVPVVLDAACGLVNGEGVSLNVDIDNVDEQDATASGNVACTPSAASSSSTSSSGTTSTSGGSLSSSATASASTSTSGSDTDNNNDYNTQLAACYVQANNGLLLAGGLSLLLILLVFAVSYWATRRR